MPARMAPLAAPSPVLSVPYVALQREEEAAGCPRRPGLELGVLSGPSPAARPTIAPSSSSGSLD